MKDETYQPGGYHSFEIEKPKRRLVNAAPFRDRVVRHALMNAIEPLFERQFIFDSYANRKGKGTHAILSSVLVTCRQHSVPILDYLVQLQRVGKPPPPLASSPIANDPVSASLDPGR